MEMAHNPNTATKTHPIGYLKQHCIFSHQKTAQIKKSKFLGLLDYLLGTNEMVHCSRAKVPASHLVQNLEDKAEAGTDFDTMNLGE